MWRRAAVETGIAAGKRVAAAEELVAAAWEDPAEFLVVALVVSGLRMVVVVSGLRGLVVSGLRALVVSGLRALVVVVVALEVAVTPHRWHSSPGN